MSLADRHRLASHLRRHARTLHNIACGFGRRADADDIIQILYSRWWRRMLRDPAWSPPEETVALFVCVKRVVLDELAKQARQSHRNEQGYRSGRSTPSPEEGFHAFRRLEWIMARLPAKLAEVLMASLSSGQRPDESVARELGLSHRAYTTRLFNARRAAERLAMYYDVLPPEQAHLMAELGFSGKTRAQVAHELGLLLDELGTRLDEAARVLDKQRAVAAL
jgi:DNA-directed RNA polymerase specialized sigma24 family protein